jgi:hypothetical protein
MKAAQRPHEGRMKEAWGSWSLVDLWLLVDHLGGIGMRTAGMTVKRSGDQPASGRAGAHSALQGTLIADALQAL